MKSYRAAAAVTAVISFMVSVKANADIFTNGFCFDVKEKSFNVDIALETPQKAFGDILVLPYGVERENLSPETVLEGEILYKKVYTSESKISENVELGKAFKAGEYVVYVECGEFCDKSIFILPSDSIKYTIDKVNSAGVIEDSSFGADEGVFNENKEQINALMKNLVADTKFNEQSFIDGYMQSSGVAQMINKKLTFDEFLDLFGSYFGEYAEKYENWNDESKEELLTEIKAYKIGSCTPQELLEGAEFLAACKAADEQYALIKTVEEYIENTDLSYGDFDSLNSYYKNAVGSELRKLVKGINSAEELYEKFIEISEEQYKKQKKGNTSNGGGGGGSSGGGSSSGGSFVVGGASGGEDIMEEDTGFSDIKGHWSEEYIIQCCNSNIINGYDDNTYRPDAHITRAETASLLSKLFKLNNADTDVFYDVTKDSWFRASVSAVYNAGIANGYNGYFRPTDNISREEFAVMIYRALEKYNIALEGKMSFEDDNLIADYAKESISKLAANSVITGSEGMFRPKDRLTRAEAAALICRVKNGFMGGEA